MRAAKCIDDGIAKRYARRSAGRMLFITMIAVFVMLASEDNPLQSACGAEARQSEAAGKPPSTAAQLPERQQRIADRFRHFEDVLLRMAELTAKSNPQRAELLRKVVAQSKEQLIGVQFQRLVELLDQQRLAQAMDVHTDLQRDLQQLLKLLLSANRQRHIDAEKARLREHLKQLDRIIRRQKALQSHSESSNELQRLADGQGELSRTTGRLAAEIAHGGEMSTTDASDSGGNPSDVQGNGQNDVGNGQPGSSGNINGKSSGAPAAGQSKDKSNENDSQTNAQLQAARDKMKKAQKSLEEAQRAAALKQQEEALQHLQEAKARLEKFLRQLREEEMKRTLVTLQARFENMLKLEQEVYRDTLRLDRTSAAQRRHEQEIAAVRLATRQSAIVQHADKVLLLLRNDGTAVAFPEIVAQIRDDMQEAADRLGRRLTGQLTQAIEEDVMASLEEMIEALRVEIKKLEQSGSQQPSPDSMQREPPLIQYLAELKMIRALQIRVNRRTVDYAKLLDTGETHNVELRKALQRLAGQEAKIQEITRKLGEQQRKTP